MVDNVMVEVLNGVPLPTLYFPSHRDLHISHDMVDVRERRVPMELW